MNRDKFIQKAADFIFNRRALVVGGFCIITIFMLYSLSHLRVESGFEAQIPMKHSYMKTFTKFRSDFGGSNRLIIAMMAKNGDIFTPEYLTALENATNEVFFTEGVDRSRVKSIFTPNVRFTEVDEEGFTGGNVVPAEFKPTPEWIEKVRKNIIKSPYVGRLVANDFSGAIISAELFDTSPETNKKINARMEELRQKYTNENVSVHILGFATFVGAIADGTTRVVLFFGISFLITTLMIYIYTRSKRLTLLPLVCSLIAVVWQLGMLPLLDVGLEPIGILVPFLIFAIGVSHSIQMIRAVGADMCQGMACLESTQGAFKRLLIPGLIALASDGLGFFVISVIEIKAIQNLAIAASLGVVAIFFTNLILLPVLISYLKFDDDYSAMVNRRMKRLEPFWKKVSRVTRTRSSLVIILISLGLAVFGVWKGADIKIGDVHRGAPELRADSVYNQDVFLVNSKFSIGMDTFTVFAKTTSNGCVDHDIMSDIDTFVWHLSNVPGVQSVGSMVQIVKMSYAGWNEGHPKWRTLPRNPQSLSQAGQFLESSTGLLNPDCSVMPLYVDLEDHKAETIQRVVNAVKSYNSESGKVSFLMASGNAGIMAATNEEVKRSQYPILLYVFGAVIFLCMITFRSARVTLCIVLPLALVSLLGYAVMSLLQIGLKVNTLPVVALGAGVGVDYGIYTYSRMESFLKNGDSLEVAYERTLDLSGYGVILTGLTLSAGVATWIFSPLKFQADMGILLTFMFLVNMIGAIVLLPALARWLLSKEMMESVATKSETSCTMKELSN